jgi:hypothetical protein
MSLGRADRQGRLLDELDRFCDKALDQSSIYAFFHRERDALFPDEHFSDLFDQHGRRSVPPSVVAVVMALQRLEGLSDREAVERYCFDSRWRYAAGVGGYETTSPTSFSHTVLVDMRERLRRSTAPNRVFEVALDAAHEAGLVSKRRVLDSTPLYDAVATTDTITLIRSAIRALLKAADDELRVELVARLVSGDDYASSAKPQIDWEDDDAREALVDSRAKDGSAMVLALNGRVLTAAVFEAACLLCGLLGQDLEQGPDGVFRIASQVATDRVISTVDTETRHGHKTAAHGFDGYKAHVAIDPDSELVTATAVTPGNLGDASVAKELIADLLEPEQAENREQEKDNLERRVVYGDSAYGTGELQSLVENAGIESKLRTQPASAPGGRYAKVRFRVDLDNDTVTCPAGITASIRRHRDGSGKANFSSSCTTCPLRHDCTSSGAGRVINVNRNEAALSRARARQADPSWRNDYRRTRPIIERKLAHLMRRRHGGRRARVRGQVRVAADFSLLAAVHNLARLALLGLRSSPTGWTTP